MYQERALEKGSIFDLKNAVLEGSIGNMTTDFVINNCRGS